jgi:hypothetical protein
MKRKLFNWFGWFKYDVTEQLLKQMLERTDLFSTGLCMWLLSMYAKRLFTRKEHLLIFKLVISERPEGVSLNDYFWNRGLLEPRIVWILEHLKFVRHDYKDDAHFEKYGEHPYVMVKDLSFGRSIEWEPTLKKFQKFDRNGNLICEIKKL